MRMTGNMAVVTLLMITALLAGGCSTVSVSKDELPPILSQEELIRPYEKLGRIQVTREIYGPDAIQIHDTRAWGYQIIREEAAKMQADAVILPEVSSRDTTYLIIPSTEYRATGVAIKFK
jgi:hypothetical protein